MQPLNGETKLPCGHTKSQHEASLAYAVMAFIGKRTPDMMSGTLMLSGFRLALSLAREHPALVDVLDDDIASFIAHSQTNPDDRMVALMGMAPFAEELALVPIIKAAIIRVEQTTPYQCDVCGATEERHLCD